jgi:putative membrane protein
MKTTLPFKLNSTRILWLAIGAVWLFHISGMIGISLGFYDFFLPKTPLNLLVGFFLLAAIFPINDRKSVLLTAIFFLAGMFVEWVGVQYGFLFGEYYYGENLGPKFQGVPWMIGINWAVLVLVTGAIASRWFNNFWVKIAIGAALMVGLDFFMEVSAPVFDFWDFGKNGAPLRNYVAWFFIAALLHALFQKYEMKGNYLFSLNLFLAQLLFFAYFFFYNGGSFFH